MLSTADYDIRGDLLGKKDWVDASSGRGLKVEYNTDGGLMAP